MNKKTLIAVVGPTAIGKTKLAIALAQHFKTEILSADSRQFFKEMSIGTAVPSTAELQAVPHHFIQHLSMHTPYSVGDFEKAALSDIKKLHVHNNFVVLVGGSGLYVDAVVHGLNQFPDIPANIRQKLSERLNKEGIAHLQIELKERDPDYYESVDLSNPHRVIRALEVCIATGRPFSSFLKKNISERPFKTIFIGITADRKILYERINKRVDQMIQKGLVEEARPLFEHKHLNALQTVGYKELFRYFEGEITLDFAISEIKKNTRRFAKRQLTWLRRNPDILWVDHRDTLAEILSRLNMKITSEK